jgi:hypothetical protein
MTRPDRARPVGERTPTTCAYCGVDPQRRDCDEGRVPTDEYLAPCPNLPADRPGARDPVEEALGGAILDALGVNFPLANYAIENPTTWNRQIDRIVADLQRAGLLSGGPEKDAEEALAESRARRDELRQAGSALAAVVRAARPRSYALARWDALVAASSPVAAGPEAEPGLTQHDWALIEKACSWAAMETRGSHHALSQEFSALVNVASQIGRSFLSAQPGGTPRGGTR